jgi:hypothetical protein
VFDANVVFADDADRLKLTIEREDTPGEFTQLLQVFVNIDPVTGEADTTLTVPLLQNPTWFRVRLEAIRSSDGAVLFSGIDTVNVSAGTTGEGTPVQIPVTYTGPTAASVVLAPSDTAVEEGSTFTFRASAFDQSGAPSSASIRYLLVRPADSVILRVNRLTGQAAAGATAQGEVRVYATVPDGAAADTSRVLVGAVPVGAAMSPGYANVGVGGSTSFTGAVVDALGNPLGIYPVQWMSRSPAVASVGATGTVTGVAPGTAVIFLSAPDFSGDPAFTDSALVVVPAAGGVVVSTTANQRAFVTGAVGDTIVVDVTADMTFTAGELLGSYNAVLNWDPAVLSFVDVQTGDFPTPELNTNNVGSGELRFAQANANGTGGAVVIARVRLVAQAAGSSSAAVTISEMSAAQTFTNLINQVTVANGTVTIQ